MRTKSIWVLKSLGLLSLFVFLLASCGSRQSKDAAVKADLVTKAKKEKAFSGVRFMVEKGTVTLNGVCATDKARTTVETTVKGVYGVDKVVNNIAIGPVTIGTDDQLRESVDSVLKTYPAVEAIVTDSTVILQGEIEKKEVQKLLTSIGKLQPKKIESNIIVE